MHCTRPSSALLAPLAPALADLLSGQWELLYTTSGSILGASRPALLRPTGPTYQVLGEAPCRRAGALVAVGGQACSACVPLHVTMRSSLASRRCRRHGDVDGTQQGGCVRSMWWL